MLQLFNYSKKFTFKMKIIIIKIIDVFALPFVLPAAFLLKLLRRIGLGKIPLSRKVLHRVGVIPVVNHYYDPYFAEKDIKYPLDKERKLKGIDFNINEQLTLLNNFHFTKELKNIPINYVNELTYHFNNDSFCSGDAEFWYNMIRLKKPKKIIEIGSGHSTKMAQLAIAKNCEENSEYICQHICIEPFEMPWLEKMKGVSVVRKKVEDLEISFFDKLEESDILFIDSSHIIRPQGDILFEYFEILPTLKKGVIVHIHDIFSPRNYLKEWILENCWFWNEQYLLEAFLHNNKSWKIIGSLNYLKHNYFNELSSKCPKLTTKREPGSFYIQKQ